MTATPTVVILHGLHQNSWFVKPLAIRLKHAGFTVYTPHYYSLKDNIATHSHRLDQYLQQIHNPDMPLHLVAHSLGGLVARHFATHYRHWDIRRMVTLGTPHLGSVCAHYAKRLLPPLVGQSYQHALDGQCVLPPDDIAIGVIAGSRPFGIGSLALYAHNYLTQPSDRRHDGTVYVHETYLANASDHLIMPVTHTGLMLDAHCTKQVIYFLNHGQFER